ncbi:YhgE/Pip domain-containing protein [Bacillus salipaludis]|uniref:YhgE/Pip domain-containing protein n=1 Tax=Bacillus salipaludis TaxID=2547811 RepID=A0AA90R6Y8_9BACI|nr:YhgE/Pip domain-containing protein [Bacillus salipaludis]MDQ6597138.1 YhgE/Pip domain-containing protein [Bacillus salipaludis]
MGKIWHIYRSDWKNIFRVPSVALLVVGLMILPSMYAWFNIKSMWDPYGNTSGIQVAVANEDEGARISGKNINVGNETVKNLKKNHKLGWVFVRTNEAKRGVEEGDYYAYLIIPKEFSKKITSIISANPEKPEIIFGVNEKINAVAPKIASSGASSVTAQISQAFIKTVGDAIFSGFYKAGVELEKDLPSILDVEKQVFALEKALPVIDQMGKKAIELEGKLPEIHRKGQQIIELEQRIPELERAGASILKVKDNLQLVKDAGDKVLALQGKLSEIQRTSLIVADVVANLTEIETKIKDAMEQAKAANEADTKGNQEQLNQVYDELVKIQHDVQATRVDLQQKVDKVVGGINTASAFVKNELPTIEQKIDKAADFVRNDLPGLEEDIRKAADLVRTKLPEVERVIHKAADLARNDLPGFEEKVRTAADRIRQFKNSANIYDLIQFLKHDPTKESNFLSNPVLLKTKRIFPIPNYGSAMSPFYTMLALWVGATLLVASLRVDVENLDNRYRDYQLYLARLLTFLTIGIFQAAIVSFGDLFIIHTYVVDKGWFVLFSIFISMVFIVITYTLCSVFGNIGKGLAIILLVLQISSSGATFPVSVTSTFFQKLNPFMPFTYGVSMLRETVGGMINKIVVKDFFALLVFVGISFLIAFVLKKPLGTRIQKTAEKAKATKLVP